MLDPHIFLYKDDKGKLKRTKSGHYRFDMTFKRSNGAPFFKVKGLRFDLDQRIILPVSTVVNGSAYVIAEVAPEEHANLSKQVAELVKEQLADEKALLGGY